MMRKLLLISLTGLLTLPALAGREERHRAWIIHNRVAGVPPTPQLLNDMEAQLNANNTEGAIQLAMQHPNFLNVVVKNWFKPWSNQAQNMNVQLNDFVALAVGLIRDNLPFDEILYGDHLYVAPEDRLATLGITNVPAFARNNNNHYRELENRSLNWVQAIERVPQSQMTTIADTAGAITTRAFGEAYFQAGTNRRMTRFVFMNFLCHDFEHVHDVNVPDFRVRRDVERNPGDDSRTYLSKCVGCHAGQDALGGAWAYFDFTNGQTQYTPGQVRPKMNQNGIFYPQGHVTVDDSWINLWNRNQNAQRLGWSSSVPNSGNGARSLGRTLAKSRAFGECMVARSWELMCNRKFKSQERSVREQLTAEFMGPMNYNMRSLFASTLNRCVTDEN